MENDPAKIKEALQDFVDIAQDVLISDDILKVIEAEAERAAKGRPEILGFKLTRN